jgi:DNA mismatch repair protein MutS2
MINKLDLQDYINSLKSLFARSKEFILEGDINVHYRYIQKLQKYDYTSPPEVVNLDEQLKRIKKQGILNHREIFEFIKIINYFKYLKSRNWSDLEEWFNKILIPNEIENIVKKYDKKGNLIGIEELEKINELISQNRNSIRQALYKVLNYSKLDSYFIDRQIHLVNDEECVMLRGGFNRVLKGEIIGRSANGYFYVFPNEIAKFKQKESELLSKKEEIEYQYAKEFSSVFTKWNKFLSFINKEFDRFDSYNARINLAKSNNLEFILPKKDKKIILKNFCHPALKNCKSINLEYDKNILLITGVNAGGKTMLLKSILTSAFMAKYLLPMKAHPDSHIGHFKNIIAIIDDPQSVKNDISTFAGRIKEFAKLFNSKDALIGVDEIELGTDANEAASLFKIIIQELINQKIVITTHHKRLASLLANDERVELLAAIYDEEKQKPTYEFIQGTIGRSYAFETALKYGIPARIVNKAKKEYGDDLENLNLLIEKTAKLELELKLKNREIDEKLENIKKIEESLKYQKEEFNKNIENEKLKLLKEYNEAIKIAKEAQKAKTEKEFHQKLNEANAKKSKIKIKKENINEKIEIGDNVKYFNSKGIVISISGKNAIIDVDGKKITAPLNTLKKYIQTHKKTKKVIFSKPKPNKIDVKLDLHGMRYEEAMEKADKFINDALLAGLNEVIIYHGMGKGILAAGIKNLLKNHPLVKEFHPAPPNMGGYGATIVKL